MLTEEQYKMNWKDIKGGIRSIWGRTSEEELDATGGSLTRITDYIQRQYGEDREEVRKKLDQLLASFDNDMDKHLSKDESSFERKPLYDEDLEEGPHRHPLKGAFRPSTFDKTP